MTVFSSGISRALLRVCALFLCIACASFGAPSIARSGMIPPVLRASSVPLLPDLQFFIDVTGTMDVEEAAAPANSQMFKPLDVKALPHVAGVMWLRFTLAPVPAGGRSQAMLLDLGPDIPSDPVLYEPAASPVADSIEWREVLPSHRNVLLLPEAGAEPTTCYIRLDGLPGIWFSPMLRTPQDAATNWGSLSGTAALLALGVVMLLCLLRGLSERGQWRIWTALYVGVALLQGVLGMPAYGSGHITLGQALTILAPGLALMILPHVGRHLMRTRGRSPLLDAQFVLLSLPGAALALLPLLPGFGWTIRFFSLWPVGTAIFTLSALAGAVMGLGGARRFLLGCLVPPLFVAAGVMGLDYGYAANLLASAPLWGTALSALLIAGTGLPRDAAQTEPQPKTGKTGAAKREPSATARKSIAGLDAALVSSGLDDAPITLDAPLNDPNLRLLPPSAAGKTAADFSALPVDISENADPEPYAATPAKPKRAAAGADPGLWENMLRPPLDRLMREGAALSHCSLPPAVRQYAENMLGAADDLAKILDNPGKELQQSSVGEPRSPFNLQHLVREAHDAVTTAAENAGIGLAWYMPPLLGHMYEGQAGALRETLNMLLESAVRATTRGAVHLSVRRVPETADPGHLLFTVADTGAGIPPRDRSSLALTRAWELAGSNNGYLNVEYGPQGASIAFTLRLKPLENEEGTQPAAEQARLPQVSVVAESAVDRQALGHMIENLGCSSTESRSMREALECNREAPAFMLVAQYPHVGPAEADALGRFEAEALQAGLPVFKALAITKDDKQWDSLAETGYTHALLDPVDAEAFAATVREVLDEAGFTGKQPATAAAEVASAPEAGAETAQAEATAAAAVMGPIDDLPPAGQPVDVVPDSGLLRMDADASTQQREQNQLPDLFGQDAPARNFTPLSFDAPEQSAPTGTETGNNGVLLPLLPDAAPAEDDQTPIELTDLLPAEGAAPQPELSLEPVQALADNAPAAATDLSLAAPAAAPYVHTESSPEPLPGPASPSEPLPTATQTANTAAQTTDSADEFLASAGLEGPHWAAEFAAEPIVDAAGDSEPAAAHEPEAAPAPAAEPQTVAEPDAGESLLTIPLADERQLSAPAAETVFAEASAPETEAAAPLAPETIEWPTPADDLSNQPQHRATPAEFIEASLPDEPDLRAAPLPDILPSEMPGEQPERLADLRETSRPAAENAESLRAMTGRAGEATLSPVNAAGGVSPNFDVPAPAGRGAWDNYSLHDEWVGEPMPMGTPVPGARTAAQPVAPVVSPAPAAPVREEKKAYVSPSLAHPGEWVGEPMPITKPAKTEEAPATAQAEDHPGRPVEMPRTATGRLILKLLGSAGDRPADAGHSPVGGDKPDLMADVAAMSAHTDAAVDMQAPAAPAEPRRSATQLRPGSSGNSIMNFIAGAAEALRHTDHEGTGEPHGESAQVTPAPEPTPVAAREPETRPQPFAPASVPPAALVAPNTPRETDQTIPQLVARLDAAMDDAQQGFKNRRCSVVGDAANRIATESDAFGFRVLARMARCVERAAKANDMNALRDLLPELAVAVERNRIGLTPRR